MLKYLPCLKSWAEAITEDWVYRRMRPHGCKSRPMTGNRQADAGAHIRGCSIVGKWVSDRMAARCSNYNICRMETNLPLFIHFSWICKIIFWKHCERFISWIFWSSIITDVRSILFILNKKRQIFRWVPLTKCDGNQQNRKEPKKRQKYCNSRLWEWSYAKSKGGLAFYKSKRRISIWTGESRLMQLFLSRDIFCRNLTKLN